MCADRVIVVSRFYRVKGIVGNELVNDIVVLHELECGGADFSLVF